MDSTEWFDDLPVLGEMTLPQAIRKLEELGENDMADILRTRAAPIQPTQQEYGVGNLLTQIFDGDQKIWRYAAHAFGFVEPSPPGEGMLPIIHAGNMNADDTLKHKRVKITLDRLRVASYPGGGIHHILFDFYAQNQAQNQQEHLHFNSTYQVADGQQAGITGYPIFVGLRVGNEGLAFKCLTVNVKNDNDEKLLGFFESDVFRSALKLVNTLQPALAPLSELAVGITRVMANNNKNVPVQKFFLGLDFGNNPLGARLRLGSYICVQIPDTLHLIWDWNNWSYQQTTGQVVNNNFQWQLVPYNYIVFSVSPYGDEDG